MQERRLGQGEATGEPGHSRRGAGGQAIVSRIGKKRREMMQKGCERVAGCRLRLAACEKRKIKAEAGPL